MPATHHQFCLTVNERDLANIARSLAFADDYTHDNSSLKATLGKVCNQTGSSCVVNSDKSISFHTTLTKESAVQT